MHTTQDSSAGSRRRIVSPPPLFAIAAAKKGDSIRILLDLEKLTFIDAAGLSVLVAAWHRSVSNGNRLRIAHGRGNVAYILHLTALDTVLAFIPA